MGNIDNCTLDRRYINLTPYSIQELNEYTIYFSDIYSNKINFNPNKINEINKDAKYININPNAIEEIIQFIYSNQNLVDYLKEKSNIFYSKEPYRNYFSIPITEDLSEKYFDLECLMQL